MTRSTSCHPVTLSLLLRRRRVSDQRPFLLEGAVLPVHVVVLVVALLAKLVDGKGALLLGQVLPRVNALPPLLVTRIGDVQARWPVAALAADVLQMRRCLLVGEPRDDPEAHRVANDTLRVVLA